MEMETLIERRMRPRTKAKSESMELLITDVVINDAILPLMKLMNP